MPDNCIFCQIAAGKLPCHKVYEDDKVMAFLDITPVKHGHTLIIPKEHYANLEEIPEDLLQQLIVIVKNIGKSIKEKLGAPSYNVIENNDKAAGQLIPHIHFHVVPRYDDDGLQWWPQNKYGEGEAEQILAKLK